MPSIVQVLDSVVVDQIAAGEVVERPASVVKELIENAIDAQAKNIQILIENGGIDRISIIDDGQGMVREDLILAVERFATSKLRNSGDLESIVTYGFRGEALPSIASVSKLLIKTRHKDSVGGLLLELSEDNKKKLVYDINCEIGTTIDIKDLFYNVPARRKFLKSERTESNSIKAVVADFAIARPDISFLLQEGSKEVLAFNYLDQLSDRMRKLNLVQGKNISLKMEREFIGSNGKPAVLKISGLISEPLFCPKIGSKMRFLVNERVIKSNFLMRAVRDGYGSLIKHGYFPSGLVSISVSPSEVDVNVHPQKIEVRFCSEGLIFSTVRKAVSEALVTASQDLSRGAGNSDTQRDIVTKESGVEKVYVLRHLENRGINEPSYKGGWRTEEQKEIRWIDKTNLVSGSEGEETPRGLELDSQKLRFLGQVFKLYLFFGSQERVAIVDMHAAHERITFYKLKKEFLAKEIIVQEMLFPFSISIDILCSLEGIEEKLEALKILGIEAELRHNEILIRAMSPLLGTEGLQELVVELLEKAPAEGFEKEINQRIDAFIARLACHGSLRRGRELKPQEAYELMEQLEAAELSGWCPHGRPVIWWLTEGELEKQFGRIQ